MWVLGRSGHGLVTKGTEALCSNRALDGCSGSLSLPVHTALEGKGNLLSSIGHEICSMAKPLQGQLLTGVANVDYSPCSLLRRLLWRRVCRKQEALLGLKSSISAGMVITGK